MEKGVLLARTLSGPVRSSNGTGTQRASSSADSTTIRVETQIHIRTVRYNYGSCTLNLGCVRSRLSRARDRSRGRPRLSIVSQPAISKHVASLEAELGTQLVVRGRPAATLTTAGQTVADYVLRAEALLANARRALTGGLEAETGRLAIAASGIPGTYLLPVVLGALSRIAPRRRDRLSARHLRRCARHRPRTPGRDRRRGRHDRAAGARRRSPHRR